MFLRDCSIGHYLPLVPGPLQLVHSVIAVALPVGCQRKTWNGAELHGERCQVSALPPPIDRDSTHAASRPPARTASVGNQRCLLSLNRLFQGQRELVL